MSSTQTLSSVDKRSYIFKAFEIVNPDVCDKLAGMSFADFLNFWDPNELDEEGNIESVQVQYNSLTKYCREQQISNYSLERKYKYSKENPTKGRIFVEDIGLQRIYNQFRGCLCDGLYYDIDMINAHIVILYYICQSKQIPSPSLAEYVANREHYIQQLMTDDSIDRDKAKRLFLTVLNRGYDTEKYNGKKIKNKFFLKFDKDIRIIQKKLIEKFPIEAMQLEMNNYKAKHNLGGCLTNLLMTTVENNILQKVITYIKGLNIIPDVPMFDGLMFRRSSLNISVDVLVQRLNTLTRAYGVKWCIKQHNTELKSRILSLVKCSKLTYIDTSISSIGKYVWEMIFKSRMISCNDTIFFKSFTDNLYITNKNTIRATIHNYISNQDLYILIDAETTEPLTRKFKNVKDVSEHIMLLAQDAANNDKNFTNTLFEKTLFKLNFNNGVYDFKENKFINNPTAVEGLFKIKYDYSDDRNIELINEIYDRIINPIFGIKNETDLEKLRNKTQLRDCILYRLARAVAGFFEDKNWFMLEGLRNSGKGVLFGLLETAIGDYLSSCDSNNFLLKGISLNNDSAKENMFLFDFQFQRIINIQEFKFPSGKPPFINGGLIKSICSGGDKIETRAHYGMPVRIRLQSTLVFAANEYPEIRPSNAVETCTVWAMNGKFIDYSAGETEIEGYMNYPCDTSIKQFIKQDDVGLAFIHILISALGFTKEQSQYPSEIRNENILANEQFDTVANNNIISQIIRFTGLENDIITNSELSSVLIQKNIIIGKMLLAKQLKNIGAIPHRNTNGVRGYSKVAFITN